MKFNSFSSRIEDIKRLHYFAFSDNPIRREFVQSVNKRKGNSLFVGFLVFFIRFARHIGLGIVYFRKLIAHPKDIIFVVSSRNHYDSLFDIYRLIESESTMLGYGATVFGKTAYIFPMAMAYLVAAALIPFSMSIYFKFSEADRKIIKCILPDYLVTFGLELTLPLFLRYLRPRIIVMANDHNFDLRILNVIARERGIKTIYVQHASVAGDFPKLNFDLTLLEGEDAKIKYLSRGSDVSTIKLVGMPKYDKFISCGSGSLKFRHLGVCVNIFDRIDYVKDVIRLLKNELPLINITLRLHPSDRRYSEFCELAVDQNIIFSDSHKIKAFDFLRKVDVMVAGDSSIHLEAALMNVYPVYFLFNDNKGNDNYGYVKKGLVEYVTSKEELLSVLKRLQVSIPSVKHKTKYYNSVIGTIDEGRSAELAANFIKCLMKK